MRLEKKSRIIFALDLKDKEKAIKACAEVSDYIDAIKVGYPFVLKNGVNAIWEIKEKLEEENKSKPIIADFKVADIPEISRVICEEAVNSGADYVIVHGFVGESVVAACSEVAKIFVVCDMTHSNSEQFISRHVLEIAEIAKKHAFGIVAPATKEKIIKNLRKIIGEKTIISPGIKAQGAKPGAAINAGADFEIIGRAIYNARDKVKAVKEIMEEIKKELAR